jgi:hypothetical protein
MYTYPPPPSPEPKAASGVPALTPEQLTVIQQAEQRAKKIKQAVVVARIDGGLTAFFGIVGILSICLGWVGPVVGLFFFVLAFNSFRCAGKLAKFDVRAPGMLAMNQLYLAAVIIAYALYQLYAGLNGDAGSLKELEQVGLSGAEIADMMRSITKIIYLSLIAGTVVAQGLTAMYYASRRKYVEAYRRETPPWIIDLQGRVPAFSVVVPSPRAAQK